MASRIWKTGPVLLLLFIVLASSGSIRVSSSASGICPAPSPVASILQLRDSCSDSDFVSRGSSDGDFVGVTEVDEVSLQRALNLVHMRRQEYVALLFHATWCPFSKTLRSNFSILSSLFPNIHHFAVEESSVRPRVLSRYGIHGFPTLFLLNSTIRIRYHGSRTPDSLFSFYYDVTALEMVPKAFRSVPRFISKETLKQHRVYPVSDPLRPDGMKPAPPDRMVFERIWNQLNLTKADVEPECPFSWARSPEKLLQQETYLILAITFVLLRLLYFLLPTLKICVEQAWRQWIQNMSLRLWEHPQSCLQQAMQALGRMKPCKRSNLQEGAMNAKAWASKSLATVSIGEASSSRVCLGSER